MFNSVASDAHVTLTDLVIENIYRSLHYYSQFFPHHKLTHQFVDAVNLALQSPFSVCQKCLNNKTYFK
jgi:hypothetical protein